MPRRISKVAALTAFVVALTACQTTPGKSYNDDEVYSFASYREAMEKKDKKLKNKSKKEKASGKSFVAKNKKSKKLLATHKKKKKLLAHEEVNEADDSFSLYTKKSLDSKLTSAGKEERYASSFDEN
jgi:hypothetical protein